MKANQMSKIANLNSIEDQLAGKEIMREAFKLFAQHELRKAIAMVARDCNDLSWEFRRVELALSMLDASQKD